MGKLSNLNRENMGILRGRRQFIWYWVLVSLIAILMMPQAALAQKAHNVSESCEIRIGRDGKTWRFSGDVDDLQQRLLFSDVPASDFIRSTRGPCTFDIFNKTNYGGRHVTLGTDLSKKIRAGTGGVDGSGDTWRIRSIIITKVTDKQCKIRIGGNGVRMTYYSSRANAAVLSETPAMNRISYIKGSGCKAILYNSSFSSGRIKEKRAFNGPNYDPGFRVRSFSLDSFW
ncbi:MAG: hypothetical protein H6641_05070 [Caldilineaceae bacterium]|nr:hypothetical protein [Caldilineaceae bacterium]